MSTSQTKESLIKEINESSFFFGEISDELKKDVDIAKALIKNQGSSGFDKIDPSFKADREIILLAYENDDSGWNSHASKEDYVPKEFINDVEVISAAVKAGWSLDKVPEGLKEDKNILMAGVQNDPRSYEKLSDEQKNDEDKKEVQEFFNEFNKLVPMTTNQIDNTINQLRSAYEKWLKDLNSRLLE